MASPDDGSLRASDADRQRTADRLKTAHDEGRLSLTEYDERLQRAYAAVTLGDLASLTKDLPEPRPQDVEPDERKPVAHREKAIKEWRAWAGVSLLLIAIWAVTSMSSGELHPFWPLIPIAIWGVVNVADTISGDWDRRRHRRRRRLDGERDDD